MSHISSTLKLTIELVPTTCWFSNLRDHLSKEEWNLIKKVTFKKANNRCQICNGVGNKWPVECHEIWEYDDILKIQKLNSTIALCPNCHKVKHIGFAIISGNLNKAKAHFKLINKISENTALNEINSAFIIFNERSKYNWNLDISWIENNFNMKIKSKR